MASGAAVRGASTRPIRYPAQLVVMVSDDTVDELERNALLGESTKSEAARAALGPGLELVTIASEYVVSVRDLVNAARLWAIHESTTSASTTVEVTE